MMPRLGAKYPVEIETVSKPNAEYQTDEYFELDLPVAPAVMVDDEIVTEGSDVAEEKLEAAEVKAPWVILQKMVEEPESSFENKFNGFITRIHKGKVNSECVVGISDGTELCSIITTESIRHLGLKEDDRVWARYSTVFPWCCMPIDDGI